MIHLQAIPTRMSCNNVLEWMAESDGEAAMDPAGAEVGEDLEDDDGENKPAETAVCAFVAYTLHKGSHRGSLKPF